MSTHITPMMIGLPCLTGGLLIVDSGGGEKVAFAMTDPRSAIPGPCAMSTYLFSTICYKQSRVFKCHTNKRTGRKVSQNGLRMSTNKIALSNGFENRYSIAEYVSKIMQARSC